MKVDVLFTPASLPDQEYMQSCIVVAIDVLRASASICSLLHQGAHEIVLCSDTDSALQLSMKQRHQHALLVGERHGFKPAGFHYGNSPVELLQQDFTDKTILYSTTNGTRLLRKTAGAAMQLVASFVNLEAAVQNVITSVALQPSITSILLCCAGTDTAFSLEDSFFAGAFVSRYIAHGSSHELTDAAKAAICIANSYNSNIRQFLLDAQHAQYLIAHGFAADVDFCLNADVFDIVPVCRNGVVTRL